MQAHATIPLTSSTLPQPDSDSAMSSIHCSHTTTPLLQCACQKSATITDAANEDDLQLDKLFLLMGRMNVSPLNSQRAAVPELVSQGVIPMGWRVRRSTPQGPAELQFFERLERADTRRFADQCSPPPTSLRPKAASPVVFYLESMRQTEATESPITGAGPSQVTPTSDKCVRSSSTTALNKVDSEGSDAVRTSAGPLTTTRPRPKKSLPQLAPSIFSFRRKSPGRSKSSGPSQRQNKSPKAAIRRLLLWKEL